MSIKQVQKLKQKVTQNQDAEDEVIQPKAVAIETKQKKSVFAGFMQDDSDEEEEEPEAKELTPEPVKEEPKPAKKKKNKKKKGKQVDTDDEEAKDEEESKQAAIDQEEMNFLD